MELDPNNGEYQAYRYWIDYLKGSEPEAERIGKVKANLLDVAKHFPRCFAAVRFLSLIFNKLKDQVSYEQYLIRVQCRNRARWAPAARSRSCRRNQSSGKPGK